MALSPEAAKALDQVKALDKVLQRRRPEIDKYDDYYCGRHPLAFASPQFKAYWGSLFDEFADNWCPLVVNSTAERISLAGIRVADEVTDSSRAIDKDLWRVAMANDIDAQSGMGFLDGLISSRVYVLVWGNPDDEETPEITWEHPSQAIVAYQPGGRKRIAALKRWDDDTTQYATLYTPDLVWKWQRPRSSVTDQALMQNPRLILPVNLEGPQWEPRQPAEDDTWPIRNPMGVVPMAELPVRPRLVAPPESELADVVPLQDYINLLWSHLATASDFVAMPQRVVLGAQQPKRPIYDDNGVKVGEEPIPLEKFAVDKVIWITPNPNQQANPQIASWPQADLSVYTNVIENMTGHVAAQSRTPQHYLVGKMANLSADALRAAEAGLVSKVRERIASFTPGLREMFRLVALAQGDTAKAQLAQAATILWKNPETRSEAELTDSLVKKKALNIADEILWEQSGMTPTDIARNKQLLAEQAQDPTTAALLSKLSQIPANGNGQQMNGDQQMMQGSGAAPNGG